MLKKIWLFLGLLVSVYLLIPGPKFPPPDLPESLKSDEPGDTVQLINVSAYFTDSEREKVIAFYQDYFSRSSFLDIPLPVIRLNHPPEYAKQVIKDTMQTYYFEELVHPFRESLYVNGFEWERDVFTAPEKREKNRIFIADRIWKAKVTLRWFPSNLILRVLVFWAGWLLLGIIFFNWFKQIKVFFKK